MPALGADMEAGTLVEWLIKPGDRVKRGDVVAVVETQKGAIEVEIFEEGIVSELVVPVGTKVPVGGLLARIGEQRRAAADRGAPLPRRRHGRALRPQPRPAAARRRRRHGQSARRQDHAGGAPARGRTRHRSRRRSPAPASTAR